MKDRTKKRLTIAGFLGVISLGIASLSFSFAWYASGAEVVIDGLDINVRAERNLLISTSTEEDSFKNKLSYGELDRVALFDPVSSMYKDKWMDQKTSKPEFYRYEKTEFVDRNNVPYYDRADIGFYSQTLYLRCDDDVWVTLDKNMIKVTADEELNRLYAEKIKGDYKDLTVDEITERLNSLEKCMRISLLVPDEDDYKYYIIDPYKDEDNPVLMGGRQDLNKDGYYDHYTSLANSEMYETIYGEINDRSLAIYDDKLTSDTELVGEETSFNAMSMENVHPFNLQASLDNGLVIKEEESLSLDELESEIIIPMYNNVPKEIVLSIYMEGWDTDCINAHMGGSFNLELSFMIEKEMRS